MIPDIINFGELKNLTKDAVKASYEKLLSVYKNEDFTGYALCTDDGVMTIYHVGCTQQWLSRDGHEAYTYAPVEWTYEDGETSFDAVYELLIQRVEKQDEKEYKNKFEDIIDLSYNSFVQALLELRNEGFFSDDVFLSVLSTDPSDHMIELELNAIKLLNSPEILSKWEAWDSHYN